MADDQQSLSPKSQPRLRIVHVLRQPLGGLFRHVCDLAEGQRALGHEVGVICCEAEGAVASQMMKVLEGNASLGIHFIRISRLPGISDIWTLTYISKLMSRLAPDIVHGHGAKGGAYARLLSSSRGLRRIYTPHGGSLHFSPDTFQGWAYLSLERFLMRRSHGILFESRFGQATFETKVAKLNVPHAVVHNGVAQSEFDLVSPFADASDLVFIGELRELKGIGTLLEALRFIGRHISLRIVGSGPDRDAFEALALEMPHHVRVAFLGAMPARKAFALGRIVVMPSHAESLPYIALEAIAAGRPLIATRVGGVAEIYGDHAEGLIPAGDPVALRTAIKAILDDPVATEARAKALREHVRRHFSTLQMVQRVDAFYAQVLSSRPAPQSNKHRRSKAPLVSSQGE